jgi:hypothetical protein
LYQVTREERARTPRNAQHMGRNLTKHRNGREAECENAPPILVTEWGDFTVEGGVLFVPLRSGFQPYTIAMGPALAFKAIDRARKALQRGCVEKLMGLEAH